VLGQDLRRVVFEQDRFDGSEFRASPRAPFSEHPGFGGASVSLVRTDSDAAAMLPGAYLNDPPSLSAVHTHDAFTSLDFSARFAFA